MPWTADQFKSKHWGDASPAQAAKAASMANAMLKAGTPEGEAIATAIKNAKRMRKVGMARAMKK